MCIGELNCPSLEYVYDMTWAEYMIRLYAHNRQEKTKLFLTREIAWASIIGPNQNPKKMPKSKEQYWPMKDEKNVTATDLMKERIKMAQERYKEEQLKAKNNGR